MLECNSNYDEMYLYVTNSMDEYRDIQRYSDSFAILKRVDTLPPIER